MKKYIPVLEQGYPKVPCYPNFRSSGTGSCERELAMLARREKSDKRVVQQHQTTWQNIGTKIGDMIQEDILIMEKHYERLVGEPFYFRFERVENDAPNFEQFSTKYKVFEKNGLKYSTGGSVDGVMIYTDPVTFKETRIGLEVKSKQSSYSATGHFSMREANPKHVSQVTNYSLLNDLDHYMIMYVNCSHKSWNQTEVDYEKYPDIRVFGLDITETMKEAVKDKFFRVCEAAESGILPKLELNGWLFNDYKKACALSLSYEELEELEEEASPKQAHIIEEIKRLRGDIV